MMTSFGQGFDQSGRSIKIGKRFVRAPMLKEEIPVENFEKYLEGLPHRVHLLNWPRTEV